MKRKYTTVKALPYLIGVKRLSVRSVLYLFKFLKFETFICEYHGKEIYSLEELRSLINPNQRAITVLINYYNHKGQKERGNLIAMFLEFLKYRDIMEGLK